MKQRIININTLKEKKYDELDLGSYYNDLFGTIESKTSIFIYGSPGSGKSVFTIKLANEYADLIGKTLYNSHEEALKKSMRDRAINFNLCSKKLYIGATLDFDYLVKKITSNHYRMVIIDSVQYMSLTYEQIKTLNSLFAKRKIIFVYVSFGNAYKNPKCSHDIMHSCDIKLYFDAGMLTIDSRYKSEITKVKLFTPKKAQGANQNAQGTLF